MTYRPIELPPQTATTAFVCDVCSAIVVDPRVHSSTHGVVEPRQQRRVPNVELTEVKL